MCDKPRPAAWAFLLFLFVSGLGFAEAKFSGLDLREDQTLLFESSVDAPDFGNYSTLFQADAGEKELEQLTFYPEHMSILADTGRLQIQNRYGVFRTDGELEGLSPVEDFPAFVRGEEITSGKVAPVHTSPDGRYLLTTRENSPGFGTLVLRDLENGEEAVISEEVKLDLSGPPAKWAPDSEYFIYSKENTLYYFSVAQLEEERVMDEDLRDLGRGSVNSASWADDGSLYYVSGSLVHRIRDLELFPRTLYEELLRVGEVVGKIPFVFDANFDEFWIAPDGDQILFNKGGRNVFLFYLQGDDYVSTGATVTYPYLFLPRNTRVEGVAWSSIGTVTIVTEGMEGGRRQSNLYRMSVPDRPGDIDVTELDSDGVRDIVLSPDEQTVAVLYDDEVELRDYESWRVETSFAHRIPHHLIWRDEDSFVVGGDSRIELVNWREEERRLVTLSQTSDHGFERESGEVLVRNSENAYRYKDGGFEPADRFSVRGPKVSAESVRVYLERLDSGTYDNIVMVRNTEGVGTTRLFPPPEREYEPIPEDGEPVDLQNFTHGNRTRAREVSFVFNAVDSVEGLTTILDTLSDYDISATFFINGDFMQRHPDAVREIADSDHEVGSLFYSYFDMTDSKYEITEDFITDGLARNEDEYFEITGSELSLLWHTPYYFVSPEIISGSQEMNYTYVGRDVDALDWVPRTDGQNVTALYRSNARIVERILEEKKPGSIIAMRIGTPGEGSPYGGRDDYLFQKLDLLINRLTERGYDIVPVSKLIEHAE
ncbi:MAG: polysaccharide deacetylase family protein [Spirochaetota bacterium]